MEFSVIRENIKQSMDNDSYWSQDTLLFFAVCALFTEKISNSILSAEQLSDYIMNFEDMQTEELLGYQSEGLLKFKLLGKPENLQKFLITEINHLVFKKKLVNYLEKYRENELLPGYSTYNDSYEDNRELLYLHLQKSKRDNPNVNPRNIWRNWSGRPFWETILTADILDGDLKILNFEIVPDRRIGGSSIPIVQVKLNKLLAMQTKTSSVEQPAELRLEQVSFSKWLVYIELEDGSKYLVKENLTEGHAPHGLLTYLVKHPGELVTLKFTKNQIRSCGNVSKLGEPLRQCYLDGPLKELLFDECGNTEVRLKKKIQLSKYQLIAAGLKLSE